MRALAKVGLVGAGYVGAVAVSAAVVALYIFVTPNVDRVNSSGMTAFGDSLLFLAVFGIAAVVPTGAALFWLRPYRRFWTALSVASLVIAMTAIAAFVDYRTTQMVHSVASVWSFLAVLRILIAPLLAIAGFVAAAMAPARAPRLALLVACAVETAVFGSVVFILLRSR